MISKQLHTHLYRHLSQLLNKQSYDRLYIINYQLNASIGSRLFESWAELGLKLEARFMERP